jgi:hypothetical protein
MKKQYVQIRMWKSSYERLRKLAFKERLSIVELLDILVGKPPRA